ncbi:GNAT domain-containing protein [Cinnamomum micranthum f. kanehirae]|uniref:GNAT domain-containing protein n=1 Tax=Cinnamomum micranthum f. kanehirae TaxID=337451 RepID=A0A443PHU4_9MAGN|nr:GNAT domain-containing protein [Cinnamomum micranthum f. kanehirae]
MFMGMAHLKTCLNPSLISKGLHRESPCIREFTSIHTKHITESALVKCRKRINADCMNPREKGEVVGYVKWVSAALVRNGGKREILDRRACWPCKTNSTPAGEVGVVRKEAQDVICGVAGEEQFGYLVSEYGWGVRRLVEEEEEMRKVAQVQAEAFHEPKALFNDLFFLFFQAEVLSALFYKIRNSPPNRYACLVAEPVDRPDSLNTSKEGLVGVVDVTVMRDEDVLKHIDGAEEYLYVSGIAVMKDCRRQKVATVLLKACDLLSLHWGFDYLALRAYEDDSAACKLYSAAGYKVVSGDPNWMTTWIGRKRRVLMIKQSGLNSKTYKCMIS